MLISALPFVDIARARLPSDIWPNIRIRALSRFKISIAPRGSEISHSRARPSKFLVGLWQAAV